MTPSRQQILMRGLGLLVAAQVGLAETDVEFMRERIHAYHGAGTRDHRVLHLVYFHPRDAEPLKTFRPRIARMLDDIQDFYRHGMIQNGFGDVVFSLDRVDGDPRIHVVTGRKSGRAYDYGSGSEIVAEIEDALAGTLDLKRSFVLILHGLTDLQEDGSYLVHAPYYGDGSSNHRRGLCHAADCEVLDPALLLDTERRVRYTEHTGTFDQTLADFNVKYLGGVAHELGHGLGLPHTGETRAQHRALGTALMGSGNHTYRKDLRTGKGSFLHPTTAARLASHPLFTRSDRGVTAPHTAQAGSLQFTAGSSSLSLAGTVEASPEVYAVLAYSDREGGSDYDALTTVTPVREGRFSLAADCERPGAHELRLVALHVNGAVSTLFRSSFGVDDSLVPDTAALQGAWSLREIEEAIWAGRDGEAAERAGAALDTEGLSPDREARLRYVLRRNDDRPDPVRSTAARGDHVDLSGLVWKSAKVGWGKPARDQYYFDRNIRDAVFLAPGGRFHARGLYAHAPSRYVFDLHGAFKTFTASAGLQEGVPEVGSAVFIVRGDGRELFRSPLLKGTHTVEIAVSIQGIDRLELQVESGKPGNACCWSVWGSPTVSR